MRFYIVVVKPRNIYASERTKPINTIHARAVVDGEDWIYQIAQPIRSGNSGDNWFERGLNYVFYHAKNGGDRVEFKQVNRKRRRTKKISDKQLSLFEGIE